MGNAVVDLSPGKVTAVGALAGEKPGAEDADVSKEVRKSTVRFAEFGQPPERYLSAPPL
jgi:hypothetical protein